MSKALSKQANTDKATILWGLFRDVASKKMQDSDGNAPTPTNRDFCLQEAQGWMSGDYLKPVKDICWPDFKPTWNMEDLHDKYCPIFQAKGYLKKRDVLADLIKSNPRWVFDPCAVEMYFNACSEQDYRFFKVLGKSLCTNKSKNRARNDLYHLQSFVHQKLPLFIYEISIPEAQRKEIISKALKTLYYKVEGIIKNNVELQDLMLQPVMKDENQFRKTCIKWFSVSSKK